MIALLSIFVLPLQVLAAPQFNNLRIDETIPEKCQQMNINFYQLPADYFFVGRNGALSMGYTFEYPIERTDATILWNYFRAYVKEGYNDLNLYKKIQSNPDLKRDYEILMSTYQEQNFDFGSEGEVLEALAIHRLYEEFPENTYFITGGIEYKNSGSHTLGELDLYVGHRDTCEAVAIGEAKLGTQKMLNKARKQLARFENFLSDNDGPELREEYKPHFFEDGDMRDKKPIDQRQYKSY